MKWWAWAFPMLLVLMATPAAAEDQGRIAFRFADERIDESSGLIDTGRAMYTVNDSGNAPLLFRLDPRSGRTIATIRYAAQAVDTEAIAPGPGGDVWVGDIGDNTRSRHLIDVHRVDGRTGSTRQPAHYRLKYPDGAHDAEALIAAPDGSLYVVTKSLLGGAVYRASSLSPRRVNLMSRMPGDIGGLVTDGALMPDGRHVLLRNYAQLSVLTFPDFERIGTMALPPQGQGEAISVSPGGRIRISSEGLHAPVLDVRLTTELVRAMAPTGGSGSPSVPAAPATSGSPSPQSTHQPIDRDSGGKAGIPAWTWLAGGLGLLGVILGGIGVLRPRTH